MKVTYILSWFSHNNSTLHNWYLSTICG